MQNVIKKKQETFLKKHFKMLFLEIKCKKKIHVFRTINQIIKVILSQKYFR